MTKREWIDYLAGLTVSLITLAILFLVAVAATPDWRLW